MDIENQTNIEIILNVVNKIRKKLGIQSVQQLEILLAAMMHEEQQQNQIESRLGLSPAQLSMNLPWMKTNGLVADPTGPDKSKMVDLTPKTKQFREYQKKVNSFFPYIFQTQLSYTNKVGFFNLKQF